MPPRRQPDNPMPPRQVDTALPDWEPIALNLLVLDSRLQPRVQLDETIVEEYRTLFHATPVDRCHCPAIIVYSVNGTYLVADGHHRVTAARRAGRAQLHAHVIRDGSKTLDDAWVHTMQVNITSGLSYNNRDKQKIITWLLDHPTYSRWGNKDLERLCKGKITDQTFINHRNARKIKDLDVQSTLDQGSKKASMTPVEVARRRARQINRVRDTIALLLMGDEEAGVRQVLEPYLIALREAMARYEAAVARLEVDAREGDDL